MVNKNNTFWIAVTLLTLVGNAPAAFAGIQLQDIVRLKGAESSKIIGMGIVVGLNGTGDDGKFGPAMRPLTAMANRLIDPTTVAQEMSNLKNVALVYLSVKIPSSGVREGDQLDVHVAAPGAKSLQGGRLILCPVMPPIKPRKGEKAYPLAYAEGAIKVEGEDNLRTGVIKNGATMTIDIYSQFINEKGQITLIINQHHTSFSLSNLIANMINDLKARDGAPIAKSDDQKNIVINIPTEELNNPVGFISEIMSLDFDPSIIRGQARVVINEKSGTIVWTGNVHISPVIITHKDLSITTITPAPRPTPEQPNVETNTALPVDPQKKGGATMKDLQDALNMLKVGAQDQIAIVKQLNAAGAIHAQVIYED